MNQIKIFMNQLLDFYADYFPFEDKISITRKKQSNLLQAMLILYVSSYPTCCLNFSLVSSTFILESTNVITRLIAIGIHRYIK